MSNPSEARTVEAAVLIIDGDIVSRHAISAYLRNCGYAVVEAANTDEAVKALAEPKLGVDVILCDIAALGTQSGFELAQWVRETYPALEVRLAGSLDGIAQTAADLCQSGPHLDRPYEPDAVVGYIKRLRAARDRAET